MPTQKYMKCYFTVSKEQSNMTVGLEGSTSLTPHHQLHFNILNLLFQLLPIYPVLMIFIEQHTDTTPLHHTARC